MDSTSDGFLTFAEGKAIRCTLPNCTCDCFCPGKLHVRTCENCKHGWVIHALDKLGYNSVYPLAVPVEVVLPNIVFDIASLMLYGTQATPIRLKILLDRLFSVLQHDEVLQVLHGFGWTYEDYARGYILQDRNGRVLDKWSVATREEEQIVIQQFLRFGETKSIAQEIILTDTRQRQDLMNRAAQKDSDIKKFLERSNPYQRSPFERPSPRSHTPPRPQNLTPSSRSISPRRSRTPSPVRVPMTFDYRKDPIGAALGDRRMMRPGSPILPHRPIPMIMPDSRMPLPFQSQPQDLSTIKKEPKRSLTPPAPPLIPPPPIPCSMAQRDLTPRDLTPRDLTPRDLPRDMTPRDLTPRDVGLRELSREVSRELPMTSTPTGLSAEFDRKLKHMRKSNNPIKRNWSPANPAIGNPTSMISPSGKKRVVCNACNKTFCDKGALKIHYSAVHLKEMHRCTVSGCNMLFSSRRSRNRHSANPNPKLHRPQKQKLPEGASVVDDGKNPVSRLPGLLSERLYGSVPSMVPSDMSPTMVRPNMGTHPAIDLSDHRQEPLYYLDDNNRLSLYPVQKRPRLDGDDSTVNDNDDLDDLDSSSDGIMGDDLSIDDKMSERDENGSEKFESVSRKGKRKSMVPTRCRQPDDEDVFVMSDENSVDGEPEDLSAPRVEVQQEPKIDVETVSNDQHLNNNYDRPNEEGKMAALAQVDLMPSVKSDSGDSGVEPGEAVHQNQESRDSDGDSVTSFDWDDPRGLDLSQGEYPIDKENPRRCLICGKLFNNQFSVKMHFQNVHMKLMHKCYIDGCNASFPSRRSRDRHSTNPTLHPSPSKLLSPDDYDRYDPSDDEDYTSASTIPRDHTDIPIPDPDGNAQCHVCQERFRDNLILKEHFEKVHPREMYRCTVPHCDKMFSTRKSRNRHSQNDNLHRHLGPDGELLNVC